MGGPFTATRLGCAGLLLVVTACAHSGDGGPSVAMGVDPTQVVDAPAYTLDELGQEPRVTNHRTVEGAMERHYPTRLRSQGIGGTVGVDLTIDPGGRVIVVNLEHSSGFAELDEAGLRVARSMRFDPGRREGEPVFSRISIPITFQTR